MFFFFFKQKTAYEIEMLRSLVGSEMCIRDRTYTIKNSSGNAALTGPTVEFRSNITGGVVTFGYNSTKKCLTFQPAGEDLRELAQNLSLIHI